MQVRQSDIDNERQPEKEKPNIEDVWEVRADQSVQMISKEERKFWKKYIKKYLKPIHEDSKKKEEVELELIDLRNRACLFVYLLNAILVTVMFGLTQVNAFRDSLAIEIDCSGGTIQLVPIAILFTAVFGMLLLLQFVCMLYHRFSTLVHICATTEIWESDVTHTGETNSRLADFLIQPAVVPIAPLSTTYTDKDRKFMNVNRSLEQVRGGRKFKNLQDVVKANWEKAPLKDLTGSLYAKNKLVAQKVMDKWNNFSIHKTVGTGSKFRNIVKDAVRLKKENFTSGNDKKEKPRSRRNKIGTERTRSSSSSSEGENRKSKSDNTNEKFGSDSNV